MAASALPVFPRAVASAAPTVEIVGLTKYFSPRRRFAEIIRGRGPEPTAVVDRVSFDVQPGEIVGVLGPNGAGKTTIFKMLSTIVLPDGGCARVCGYDIETEPAAVRTMLAAVSSDERSLNWRISARENLLLFAALHHVPRRHVGQLVANALATVGLESAEAKMVAAFSSGMRQRLLIARALLACPRVLLLDEPTRALDPISAQEFRHFLRDQLIARQQCTIILATHNADEALGFCDRVVILNRGRALAIGPAVELQARFGDERYRIVTNRPDDPSFVALEARGLLRRLTRQRLVEGWSMVECAISADLSRTSHVLSVLAHSGVPIARFERMDASLADLIGRIIRRDQATGGACHA
jgi:ABC-2 type transport system ATP-binding protein